jgi:V/A-type H+-transporting ATPase subunit K
MTTEMMIALGKAGGLSAMAFAAIGSALGTGAAGMAAIGAWKKCYAQNKPAPFQLLVYVGAPLTQIFYGLILMLTIKGRAIEAATAVDWPAMLMAGIIGGIAMGMSAWMQGKAGAAGSDALAETGEGFVNYIMALGIIETVALFVMVLLMALAF